MHRVSAFLLLLSIAFHQARAADEKNIVTSTLRSATVYRTGAELVHTATATLPQGSSELIIGDISSTMDMNDLRVSCNGNVTVMSVAFSTEYLKPETVSPFVKKLQDSMESIKKEMDRLNVLIRSDNELLELLAANKNIGGKDGISVAELTKMVDYYKQKSVELRTEINTYNEKNDKWKQLVGKLENQIKEEEKKNSKTSGRLILQLMSPAAGPVAFTISYLTQAASWSPFYDLKVNNINDPLQILYKARLEQTTGLDWKKVKLSLSTSAPNQTGNAPVLKAWFLHFMDDVAVVGYGRLRKSDYYKNSTVNTISISGYTPGLQIGQDAVIEADSIRVPQYFSVNENQMDVTFDIDIPYDVPANGKEQDVVLKELKAPCFYQYYSAPKVDKDAYLLGGIPGWEGLNLLPGEANIIVEGTNVGKSFIDPSSTQDTLNLTLGRDKRIVVKKEKVVDYSSVKFLGNSKKQVFAYDITVRNNRKEKIQMLLKDQYPISTDKEIEQELLQHDGATVNNDTGILTWKIELNPGETRKYRVSYSVKYPKDKNINIY
ncbi:MAG TPA: DUF4139 domain-containing protein [Puia sp.]|nr:DUF4139 domain-containing protein [Puia sp.]